LQDIWNGFYQKNNVFSRRPARPLAAFFLRSRRFFQEVEGGLSPRFGRGQHAQGGGAYLLRGGAKTRQQVFFFLRQSLLRRGLSRFSTGFSRLGNAFRGQVFKKTRIFNGFR
jgi:hypothetical protein